MCVGDNPIAQDYNFFSDLENDDLNPKSSIFFFIIFSKSLLTYMHPEQLV